MADIETSVVISAQTDDLQSGMEAAANSVQAATEGMKAQFAGLSAAAQQAQSQISATVAQIGATIAQTASDSLVLADRGGWPWQRRRAEGPREIRGHCGRSARRQRSPAAMARGASKPARR